tara:strand:+ start:471 stop:761 length:291 start_codon:yes stop_codon:yes gene_type:complete
MSVAIRTAMGTASEIIHAKFNTRYSNMVGRSNPFPRNRSKARRKKFVNRMKTMMSKEKMNGKNSSFWMYLFRRRIEEISKKPDSGIRNILFDLFEK